MTVVTDRHTYLFDLVTSSGQPVYVLRFRYPEKAKPVEVAVTAVSLEEQAAVERARQAASAPAIVNTAWKRVGSAQLLPASVHDDDTDTFLSWPVGTPVPAILIKDEKGAEGPVNYSVRDGAIVVEGVPSLIVLRAGRESASLERLPSGRTASSSIKDKELRR